MANDDVTTRALFVNLAENTSLHGVPNAYRSKGVFRTVIWLILFLCGLSFCIYQLTENFIKYGSRPTTTTVGVVSSKYYLPFPAVTLCNMNPVLQSTLDNMPSGFASLFNDTEEESDGGNVTYFSWDTVDYSSSSEDTAYAFSQLYSQLNDSMKYEFGHKIETMLLSCTYNGFPCTPSNFTLLQNGKYGNCYTFNHDLEDPQIATSIGSTYGLSLELYLQQEEYIDDLSATAGFQVLIQNQTYMPLPEKQGFAISPGYHTFVALERYEETRDKPPYGECEEIDPTLNDQLNMYSYTYNHIDYSFQACKFTCYQQNVIQNCSCGDAGYPLESDAFSFNDTNQAPPCTSAEEIDCQKAVGWAFADGYLNCTGTCPVLCFEVSYEKHFSYGKWPSIAQQNSVEEAVSYRSEDMYERFINMTDVQWSQWFSDNTLKLSIYFQRLEYNTIKTSNSYTFVNLLSDQGGQVGLWLGLSVLTIFEVVELVWDLIHAGVIFCSSRGRRKERVSSITPEEGKTSENM